MLLRIFTEPQQGASYDQQLAVARATEEEGFDAFFRSDHFLRFGEGDGLPGPTDSWVTLAGLARETTRIRLGTLVTSATFRLPGPLAIAVAQVDAMSGGRVELGLGAGWFEDEHSAYGIPFPPTGERFDRLEEQLAIVTGFWSNDRFSFDGHHYRVVDSPCLPKPVQGKLPIIVGGWGPTRTPQLAARFADEFNAPFHPVDGVQVQFDRVRAACEEAGRDPATMTFSVAVTVCCGRDTAEVERRAEAIGKPAAAVDVAGTPVEVVEKLGPMPQWAPPGPTSRSSTSTTSTTSGCWAPRCCLSWPERRRPNGWRPRARCRAPGVARSRPSPCRGPLPSAPR